MIKEIVKYLENKKIVILGFGLEGKSTYNFIRQHLPNISLVVSYNKQDENTEKEYLQKDNNLQFVSGENYLNSLDKYDLIFKSPGISFKNVDISSFKDKITSQQEIFLEYTKALTIGITGTKGKSTTSSLIYKMISDQNKDVILAGNIGVPIFDYIDEIKEDTIVIIEMSSHGLQYIKKSPNISILLNIYEEHLDHYKSFQEYIDAKFNIFEFQGNKDFAIFNMDNENMNNKCYKYRNTDFGITLKENYIQNTDNTMYIKDNNIWYNDKEIYNINSIRKLKGEHNLNNIMFVLAVSNIIKLDLEKTIKSINEFEPLEHRLEYVGKFDNIEYYNDSIATIPESTIESIKALENVNTLLVGGNDRGVDLTKLIEFLNESKIENIICLPKTGEYIYEGLTKQNKYVVEVQNMQEAVNKAKEITKKNTICLLSPAASSYGYFKNFKERGDLFKELIRSK